MPAKTPIYLKTTTPKKGKKLRLRDVLSGDMISPPLGDVRHSAHVGPEGEGDMFGDVGFLQGKMDMLPGHGHARSHSVDRAATQEPRSFAYNGCRYQQASNGLLKSTVSMPVCVAHEQAPPKPPRLHLDQQPGEPGDAQPEVCVASAVRRLVPSSGSFSEASSEDSVSETCGPPDVRRGLSLDSDAGLSNEDLSSERSDSPCPVLGLQPADSLARLDLDLDLGPSILEDVLSIMDRYKAEDDRCEL
ncbi:cdc42 effector protein 2 [Poeciliopsis prolifica]|uniref:cdc42 effector protein 2 n=1 Tax=Poeciliopsis prolifica TaxID=188132 RepID=UPI002413BFFE|nr:cdc42 effector protein 2 [Poeciliopsis prolifica]